MLTTGLHSNKYLFGILVYNGKRKAPARWLEIIGYIIVVPVIFMLIVLWLSV